MLLCFEHHPLINHVALFCLFSFAINYVTTIYSITHSTILYYLSQAMVWLYLPIYGNNIGYLVFVLRDVKPGDHITPWGHLPSWNKIHDCTMGEWINHTSHVFVANYEWMYDDVDGGFFLRGDPSVAEKSRASLCLFRYPLPLSPPPLFLAFSLYVCNL